MQDAFVAAGDEIVDEGMRVSGIPLSDTLRHYIAITLARYFRENPTVDGLTLRLVRALDADVPVDMLRRLGDEALIATSFFEARLRRAGGSIRHYVGVGQTAYDAARMTEQAWSFAEMRDVIVSGTAQDAARGPADARKLVDAARGGSRLARDRLSDSGVVVFPSPGWLQ